MCVLNLSIRDQRKLLLDFILRQFHALISLFSMSSPPPPPCVVVHGINLCVELALDNIGLETPAVPAYSSKVNVEAHSGVPARVL